jgi:hypothetical protein
MRTVDPAEVIGALFVAVLERTRPNLQWFALIHGAALGLGGKGLALAVPREAEKVRWRPASSAKATTFWPTIL